MPGHLKPVECTWVTNRFSLISLPNANELITFHHAGPNFNSFWTFNKGAGENKFSRLDLLWKKTENAKLQ